MSTSILLAARLARAGGPPRVLSVALAAALATLVALVAGALPQAAVPAVHGETEQQAQFVAALAMLGVPVVVLLAGAGRVSSATRDRRLTSLRLLGLGLGRTAVVAGLENVMLSVLGVLAGVAVFLLSAPALGAAAHDAGWLAEPLDPRPGAVAVTAAAVVGACVLVALAPIRRMRRVQPAARSEAVRRTPGWWRAAVAVAALGVLLGTSFLVRILPEQVQLAGLPAGALLGVLAVVLTTPLAVDRIARLMTRSGTARLLAARAVQLEPAAASRAVVGIGATIYLVVGATGVIGAYASTPQYLYAYQTLHDGPQIVRVVDADGAGIPAALLTPRTVEDLQAVPGVRAILPSWGQIRAEGCSVERCPTVFVGTCAGLSALATVTGCDDTRAAPIQVRNLGSHEWAWEPPGIPAPGSSLALGTKDGDPAPVELDLSDVPIVQDVARTQETWVYQEAATVFVPVALVSGWLGPPSAVRVVADGGTDVHRALEQWAQTRGLQAESYPTWDYDEVVSLRAGVWSLAAVGIALGLVSLVLGAVDRAAESRRTIARQVALGVPGRVLRRAQVLQTLLPLAVSAAGAFVLGLAFVQAYVDIVHRPDLFSPSILVAFAFALVLGAALTCLATVPTIRTRITADLLRRP